MENSIKDGVIYYWIYGQDGEKVMLTMADTLSNRKFAEWVRIHDRYTPFDRHGG